MCQQLLVRTNSYSSVSTLCTRHPDSPSNLSIVKFCSGSLLILRAINKLHDLLFARDKINEKNIVLVR